MAQKDPQKDARRLGKQVAKEIFNVLNQLSATTKAPNLGTKVKIFAPKSMRELFAGIQWTGCPEDLIARMNVLIPGLGEVTQAMPKGLETNPMLVFDFYFRGLYEQLGNRTPYEAWLTGSNLRVTVLGIAKVFQERAEL